MLFSDIPSFKTTLYAAYNPVFSKIETKYSNHILHKAYKQYIRNF